MYAMQPRMHEQAVMAYLDGIESARNRKPSVEWRKTLHGLYHPGGVFETSRYGDAMRSRPALQTMAGGYSGGYGHLWGCEWEYVTAETIFQ